VAQGDNNRVDDRGLYAPGQQWLNREDILGRASGTFECVCVYTGVTSVHSIRLLAVG